MKRRSSLPLTAAGLAIAAALLLSACTDGGSLQPTYETVPGTAASTTSSTASGTEPEETTTGRETENEPPDLLDLADYGSFADGHTVLLPGGKWYDAGGLGNLSQISGLDVSASEIGKPTLSGLHNDAPLLRLDECGQIVFRQIRFGYERSDFEPGDAASAMALIEISGSSSIRFEQCEFFGSGGAAVFLSASENIVFEDCHFYNVAGKPFITDPEALPSQIYVRDSSFETVCGGPMPLNLRASVWEDCSFVGNDSYCFPVPAGSCYLEQPLEKYLAGKLSARVSYNADENRRLVIRDTLFSAHQTYAVFNSLENEIENLLPPEWSGFTLTGQKLEELRPGQQQLDPALGFALEVRVASREEPAPGEPSYSFEMMLDDLQALDILAGAAGDLLSAPVEIFLYDQSRRPLLNISVLPENIAGLLGSGPDSALAYLDKIELLDETIVPAAFTGGDSGQITARDARRSIEQAMFIDNEPLVFWPLDEDIQPCQLESALEFRGTDLASIPAGHEFDLEIHRYISADQDNCHEMVRIARIRVSAGNGEKRDLDEGTAGSKFNFATDTEREIISQVLAEPLRLEHGPALSLLRVDEEIAWQMTPLLVYRSDQAGLEVKLVLYGSEGKAYPVVLELVPDDAGGWLIADAQDRSGRQ